MSTQATFMRQNLPRQARLSPLNFNINVGQADPIEEDNAPGSSRQTRPTTGPTTGRRPIHVPITGVPDYRCERGVVKVLNEYTRQLNQQFGIHADRMSIDIMTQVDELVKSSGETQRKNMEHFAAIYSMHLKEEIEEKTQLVWQREQGKFADAAENLVQRTEKIQGWFEKYNAGMQEKLDKCMTDMRDLFFQERDDMAKIIEKLRVQYNSEGHGVKEHVREQCHMLKTTVDKVEAQTASVKEQMEGIDMRERKEINSHVREIHKIVVADGPGSALKSFQARLDSAMADVEQNTGQWKLSLQDHRAKIHKEHAEQAEQAKQHTELMKETIRQIEPTKNAMHELQALFNKQVADSSLHSWKDIQDKQKDLKEELRRQVEGAKSCAQAQDVVLEKLGQLQNTLENSPQKVQECINLSIAPETTKAKLQDILKEMQNGQFQLQSKIEEFEKVKNKVQGDMITEAKTKKSEMSHQAQLALKDIETLQNDVVDVRNAIKNSIAEHNKALSVKAQETLETVSKRASDQIFHTYQVGLQQNLDQMKSLTDQITTGLSEISSTACPTIVAEVSKIKTIVESGEVKLDGLVKNANVKLTTSTDEVQRKMTTILGETESRLKSFGDTTLSTTTRILEDSDGRLKTFAATADKTMDRILNDTDGRLKTFAEAAQSKMTRILGDTETKLRLSTDAEMSKLTTFLAEAEKTLLDMVKNATILEKLAKILEQLKPLQEGLAGLSKGKAAILSALGLSLTSVGTILAGKLVGLGADSG